MPDPSTATGAVFYSVVASVIFGVALWLIAPLRRWLANGVGVGAEPRLDVYVDADANQAGQPWEDWVHCKVRNAGLRWANRRFSSKTNPAKDVAIHARIDGMPVALMWSSRGPTPVDRTTIDRVNPAAVPLAMRCSSSKSPQFNVYGNIMSADVCYLTNDDFLTQHRARPAPATWPLAAGEHQFEIEVESADGQRAQARLVLTVTAPGNSLRLHRDDK